MKRLEPSSPTTEYLSVAFRSVRLLKHVRSPKPTFLQHFHSMSAGYTQMEQLLLSQRLSVASLHEAIRRENTIVFFK